MVFDYQKSHLVKFIVIMLYFLEIISSFSKEHCNIPPESIQYINWWRHTIGLKCSLIKELIAFTISCRRIVISSKCSPDDSKMRIIMISERSKNIALEISALLILPSPSPSSVGKFVFIWMPSQSYLITVMLSVMIQWLYRGFFCLFACLFGFIF